MKSTLTCYLRTGTYYLDVAGRYGGGYQGRKIGDTPEQAAANLRAEIGRYLATNPDGGDYHAPPEVLAALDAGTVATAPDKGARISYYASPAALVAINAERETTADSQSGAINALVLRGADVEP